MGNYDFTKVRPSATTTFDKTTNTFKCNGQSLTGVYSLLETMIFHDDYSAVPADVLQKARERGLSLHADLAQYDGASAAERADVNMAPELLNWIALKSKHSLEVVASEVVVSDNAYFATSVDKVMFDGTDLILGEIKTGSKFNEEFVQWQLSIGAYLFEKQTGLKVSKLAGIYLRDSKARYVEMERCADSDIDNLMLAYRSKTPFTDPYSRVGEMDMDSDKELSQVGTQMVELNARMQGLKQTLLGTMIARRLRKLIGASMTATYTPATTYRSFDISRFKAEHLDLYTGYLTERARKESLTIKFKNDDE